MKTDDRSSAFPISPPPIRTARMPAKELARRLKVRETVVRRMLDPNHDTRPEKIQGALETLGKRVVMAYDDAA